MLGAHKYSYVHTKVRCGVASLAHVGSHCLVLVQLPPRGGATARVHGVLVRVVVVDVLASQDGGSEAENKHFSSEILYTQASYILTSMKTVV